MAFDRFNDSGVRMGVAACSEEAGSPGSMLLTGNGNISTPVSFCPAPCLQGQGYHEWTIIGTITADNAASLSIRMSDNGVGISGFATLTKALGAATSGAIFMYECKLAVLGSHSGDNKQLYRHKLTVVAADETELLTDTRYQILTLDQLVNHQLGFTVTVTGDVGSTYQTEVRSITGPHFGQRSVS